MDPLADKWRAFGWDAVEVDGHDCLAIETACQMTDATRPKAIIARTTKGRGVSFMIDDGAWHHRGLNAQELSAARAEIDNGRPAEIGTRR